MTVTCWSLLVSLSSSDHFSADSVQLVQDFSPLWSWELIWWLRIFFSQNKPIEKGCGIGWKKHICENISLDTISLSALQLGVLHYSYYGGWCLILGSRCTAQTSAPKPFMQHTCLRKMPAHYSRYRSPTSTEDGRMVKAIVITIKGILYNSIRGLICPDFRQYPGKICQ